MLPKGLFRNASLNVIEWPLWDADEDVKGPRTPVEPEDFQAFRLDEVLVEDPEPEPRCWPDCGAGVLLSAGRGVEVEEDLEKPGTGSESTIVEVSEALLHHHSWGIGSFRLA